MRTDGAYLLLYDKSEIPVSRQKKEQVKALFMKQVTRRQRKIYHFCQIDGLGMGAKTHIFCILQVMSAVQAPFIVYVDDDTDDLFLVKETLKTIDASIEVYDYTNGKEALAFLDSIPEGKPLPSLVILDLNMPGCTGLQILDAIKQNTGFQQIPVFIFTNSDHPQHKALSFSKGAADFITKPYRNADLVVICSKFADYVANLSRVF